MSDATDFDDLTPITENITLGGVKHVVCEASASAAVKWRDVAIRGARMVDGKVVGMDNMARAEPLLVSECLYTNEEWSRGNKKRHVDIDEVMAFPNRVTAKLYNWIRDNSPDLEPKEDRESLLKKQAELAEKLAALDAEKAAKKEPSAGSSASD